MTLNTERAINETLSIQDAASESHALYALTRRGADIALRLAAPLQAVVYANGTASAHLASHAYKGEVCRFDSLPELLSRTFTRHSCHVFICAAGIAVRCIAPLIADKQSDPAVLVLDQLGRYVISLLSGHLGRANDHCRRVAAILDAQAVITTATDVEDLPAIDSLARQNNLRIGNIRAVKAISAALLNGEPVYLHDPDNRLSLLGSRWERLFRFCDIAPVHTDETGTPAAEAPPTSPGRTPACVVVTPHAAPASYSSGNCLYLHTQSVCAGIGCKRGSSARQILSLLKEALRTAAVPPQSLLYLASLDIKTDEPGLLEAARALGVPLLFFTRRELADFPGPSLSSKALEIFDIRGVCEPAALAAAAWKQGSPRLLLPKISANGVTVALALRL